MIRLPSDRRSFLFDSFRSFSGLALAAMLHRDGYSADGKWSPPDGKPQLSKDQLAIIHWWLNAGAPTDKKIQDLNPTPEILKALQAPTSSSTQDAPQ